MKCQVNHRECEVMTREGAPLSVQMSLWSDFDAPKSIVKRIGSRLSQVCAKGSVPDIADGGRRTFSEVYGLNVVGDRDVKSRYLMRQSLSEPQVLTKDEKKALRFLNNSINIKDIN